MTASARRRPPLSIGQFTIHALLLFALIFYGLPLLWLFLASFRDVNSLLTEPPFVWPDFKAFIQTWQNLTSYNGFQMITWILNSLLYAGGGVVLALFTCVPAGYALALSEFPGRRAILVMTLIAMITPTAAIVLPIYLVMILFGLNNTYSGLILASGFFPFGVYLSFIFFSSSLPAGIMESARVDGCGHWQLFTKIALPLSGPLAALVAFFGFMHAWTNYFLAFVLLSDDSLFNLPVGLAALVSASGALGDRPNANIPIDKPEVILAAMLTILPVLIIFIVAQRYVRSGLLAGAEKG